MGFVAMGAIAVNLDCVTCADGAADGTNATHQNRAKTFWPRTNHCAAPGTLPQARGQVGNCQALHVARKGGASFVGPEHASQLNGLQAINSNV